MFDSSKGNVLFAMWKWKLFLSKCFVSYFHCSIWEEKKNNHKLEFGQWFRVVTCIEFSFFIFGRKKGVFCDSYQILDRIEDIMMKFNFSLKWFSLNVGICFLDFSSLGCHNFQSNGLVFLLFSSISKYIMMTE